MRSVIHFCTALAACIVLYQVALFLGSSDFQPPYEIFYFLTFIVVVTFPHIITHFGELEIQYFRQHYKNPLLALFFVAGVIGGWHLSMNSIEYVVWIYMIFSVVYAFESRIAGLLTIIMLSYIPILTILEQPMIAQQFGVFAYYFFAITALIQLRRLLITEDMFYQSS